MIVLGVDPGTTTGYGVIARSGDGALSLRECGVIRTDPATPLAERLRRLHQGLLDVIEEHAPGVVAVEGVFYARNARTALVLGHMRGAILLAAALTGREVAEYSPAEVKNAVVGTGRATKSQIQFMVQRLLGLEEAPRPVDAADAVAVGICHCQAAGLQGRLAAAAMAGCQVRHVSRRGEGHGVGRLHGLEAAGEGSDAADARGRAPGERGA